MTRFVLQEATERGFDPAFGCRGAGTCIERGGVSPVSRNRVQWIAIGFPTILLGVFEVVRHQWLEPQLLGFWGNATAALLVAAAVYGFVRYLIGVAARTEQELWRARAEAAVFAERQRIGREMHDGVAQALFHLRVQLQEVDEHAAQGAISRVRQEIGSVQSQVSAAYDQVRAVIANLKQEAGSEDTGEALRRGATRVAQGLGLDLKLNLSELPHLDGQGQQHLLAIVSEAMTNARRHGGATRVSLTTPPRRLVIADNGRGFGPRQPGSDGFGLTIMAERAHLLGGRLQVESEPGRGARVTLAWGEP